MISSFVLRFILRATGNLQLSCLLLSITQHLLILGITLDCPIFFVFGNMGYLEFITLIVRTSGKWALVLGNTGLIILEFCTQLHIVFVQTSAEELKRQVEGGWYPLIFLICINIIQAAFKLMQENNFIGKMISTLHKIIYKLEDAMQS